jgi:protein-tyrosine phosphatase
MKTKILFVCMGNICRSPTAQGAFLSLLDKHECYEKFEIDSAGTHAYHIGSSPDRRAQLTAKHYGVDLSNQKARQVHESDFYYYDYIIAMDIDNLEILKSICPGDGSSEINLLLDFTPEIDLQNVPDPYYEGKFEEVFEMIHKACNSLLGNLLKNTQY